MVRNYIGTNTPRPLEERFWEKVDKHGPKKRHMRTRCWVWIAANNGKYGVVMNEDRKMEYVHRVSWRMDRGRPIPHRKTIDHLCKTTKCVRPSHLRCVTMKKNLQAGDGWGGRNHRKTHCPKGHAYNKKNTRIYRGARYCKECDRIGAANKRAGRRWSE